MVVGIDRVELGQVVQAHAVGIEFDEIADVVDGHEPCSYFLLAG